MILRLLICLAALSCLTSQAFAQSGLKAGMLEIEVRGSQKNKAEQELAVVMSRTVRSLIRGQRRWREMGKLSASLSDAKLAFGCDATNTTCMQGLAKTLGVKVLLWGTIRRDYRTVTLKIWGSLRSGRYQNDRKTARSPNRH